LYFFAAAAGAGFVAPRLWHGGSHGGGVHRDFGLAGFGRCGVGDVADVLGAVLELLGGLIGLLAGLDLHRHQRAGDLVLDLVEQHGEQFKRFALVLLLGLLLGIAAQVDALAQVVEGGEVLAPMGVDALQQHHAHEGNELLAAHQIQFGLEGAIGRLNDPLKHIVILDRGG